MNISPKIKVFTSSVHVPAAFSPQKWTDRKGHWSNLSEVGQSVTSSLDKLWTILFVSHLEPKVSLGLGKSKVDLVPVGEVRTSIRFPRGT